MKNYIVISATMLLLVGFTKTKQVAKTQVRSMDVRSKGEFEENVDKHESDVSLSPCGSCGSCNCCSCPCRGQPDCTSSCIAIKAAQEARAAAAAQQMAAAQVSHMVKAQLAEKAIQAARAAEAALAGKLFHVNRLQHEVCEAQAVVVEEANSCLRTQANLQIALSAAAHAFVLLKTLLCALKLSIADLRLATQTSQGLSEELAEKLALLESAKCRMVTLVRELWIARRDLTSISQAACRARAAARCACCCAQQRCKRLTALNAKDNEKLCNLFNRVLETGQEVQQLIQSVARDKENFHRF